MSERTIEFEVLRYRPGTDPEPTFQTYRVACQDDWVVLDALNHIKDTIDGTLSYRWSCHMAVCGSCGMQVNGEPKLACKAFVRDYGGRIRVEPLATFPIERDLIVDMDDFLDKLQSVKPWIVREDDAKVTEGEGEYRQKPAELTRYRQFSMCINCMLCYSACPQYALNTDFIGPAALALAHRYNLDGRDQGNEERKDVVASHAGVWDCTFVGQCSAVCPKDVDPAAAIQQGKIAATTDFFLGMLMPKKGDK
ncbi:succinate dehydrogenase/fumarate reductase iron-sulfur subunit [Caenispirillum bisanense]|uniref:Succinate dehydrogenase iron-sulfur subunit n=1 Tax=Caenispirillum bisanense TaxID=414052 RepID=A0A286GFC5_9PROT|nr:succinate dehydrogenase/fumarate reductase iron-sulfur subunit [Caenispirillum bisanense]SOD93714.1 succinate dehydrogenase subunit B [Caenispirillum bisanense]